MSAFWLVFLGEKAHILHTWKEDPGIKALSNPTSLTPQTSEVLPKFFNPTDPRHFKKWLGKDAHPEEYSHPNNGFL